MSYAVVMSKYLVPLDGSEFSESILPWAKFLSEKTGHGLELLRCYRELSAVYSYPDFATPPPVPYDLSGFIRTSEKYLSMVAKEHQLGDVSRIVKEGDPAETIIQQSSSEDVEAVLMNTHGRGGLGRWLLGSVATKVLRGSKKPVYILPGKPEPKIEKILIGLDGSKTAEYALPRTLELARIFGAEVTLFRALEYTPYPVSAFETALENQKKVCQSYLEQLKDTLDLPNISTEVLTINAADGILHMAKKHDLVVLSSHGHGGFERWLLGSVTEKVVQRCKTPMLIVYDRQDSDKEKS